MTDKITDLSTHVEIDEATTHRPYPYLYAQGKSWAPKAELDDLLAQANRTAAIYEKEIDMLRAEVNRLRVVLIGIAGAGEGVHASWLIKDARDALVRDKEC